MAEACHHHVLNGALLAVGELHFNPLSLGAALAGSLATDWARLLLAFARRCPAHLARLRRWDFAHARTLAK